MILTFCMQLIKKTRNYDFQKSILTHFFFLQKHSQEGDMNSSFPCEKKVLIVYFIKNLIPKKYIKINQ